MQTIKHLEMGALKIFLSVADKLGVTVFICSLSYTGYANGKMALSLFTLLCAVAFLVYLCKYFRHKPFGNKVVDVFAITMCVIGFEHSEGITLIGGATFIAALIDLGYFLYIDYCDIKRVCD